MVAVGGGADERFGQHHLGRPNPPPMALVCGRTRFPGLGCGRHGLAHVASPRRQLGGVLGGSRHVAGPLDGHDRPRWHRHHWMDHPGRRPPCRGRHGMVLGHGLWATPDARGRHEFDGGPGVGRRERGRGQWPECADVPRSRHFVPNVRSLDGRCTAIRAHGWQRPHGNRPRGVARHRHDHHLGMLGAWRCCSASDKHHVVRRGERSQPARSQRPLALEQQPGLLGLWVRRGVRSH